jgi:Polycystin cation channel
MFLQGLVLLLLLVKIIHKVSFQPRLSIIYTALSRALVDLSTFFLMVLTITCMFGMAIHVTFGPRLMRGSDFLRMSMDIFQYVVISAGVGAVQGVRNVSPLPLFRYPVILMHLNTAFDVFLPHLKTCAANERHLMYKCHRLGFVYGL